MRINARSWRVNINDPADSWKETSSATKKSSFFYDVVTQGSVSSSSVFMCCFFSSGIFRGTEKGDRSISSISRVTLARART